MSQKSDFFVPRRTILDMWGCLPVPVESKGHIQGDNQHSYYLWTHSGEEKINKSSQISEIEELPIAFSGFLSTFRQGSRCKLEVSVICLISGFVNSSYRNLSTILCTMIYVEIWKYFNSKVYTNISFLLREMR